MMQRPFSSRVLVGNWSEDRTLSEEEMNEFLERRKNGQLANGQAQERSNVSFLPVSLSKASGADSRVLSYGDTVMLKNLATQGVLAGNLDEKLTNPTDLACVTTSRDVHQAIARAAFVILKPDGTHASTPLCYGDSFVLATHPDFGTEQRFLHTERVSLHSYARFSRHQEVGLISGGARRSTLWTAVYLDANQRLEKEGSPVQYGEPVLLQHPGSNSMLASDVIVYRNDYGVEYEVHGHRHIDLHRRETPRNHWVFQNEPLPAPAGNAA